MDHLGIDPITTWEDLERIRLEWSNLWRHSQAATPFHSPEWLMAWWQHFGQGELCSLALRRDRELVGFVPLFILSDALSATRQVLFIGTGITDYMGGVFGAGFEEIGATATLSFLAERTHLWDVCDLQELPPESSFTAANVPSRWTDHVGVQEECPVLNLPDSIEQLGTYVPGHQLNNLRYYRKRAEKLGPLRLEQANQDNFEELFEALLHLHGARFQSRGEPGVLANSQVQAFHRVAARGLLCQGLLRLYGLRINNRIVASFYGFAHNRKTYYYLGGFDPEFAHLSLGSLLIGHVIEESIREGNREFDFLRGCESYKYLWGGRDRSNYRRRFFHQLQSSKTS